MNMSDYKFTWSAVILMIIIFKISENESLSASEKSAIAKIEQTVDSLDYEKRRLTVLEESAWKDMMNNSESAKHTVLLLELYDIEWKIDSIKVKISSLEAEKYSILSGE